MDNMNKPITVIREEVKEQIAAIINNSGLPAFVIEPILQDFLIEVRNIAVRQYEYDKQQYNAFLKSKEEKKDW